MEVYTKSRVFPDGGGICVQKLPQVQNMPEHRHEFVEMVYIFRGAGTHSINGLEYDVRRGDILFINYNQTHAFHIAPEGMGMYNILLRPEFISEGVAEDNAFALLSLSAFSDFCRAGECSSPLVRCTGEEIAQTDILVARMEREYRERREGWVTVLRSLVTLLLSDIFRKMSEEVAGRPERDIFDAGLLDYIREHCGEKISLQALAKQCFYNPSYFSRLFREQYGVTLTDFLSRSRLERAEQLLCNTDLPVERVAHLCGFGTLPAFYRLFRARCGVTPSQYRAASPQYQKK